MSRRRRSPSAKPALERRHGLAEIVERGIFGSVERLRVKTPHPEHGVIILFEEASRYGYCLAQQWLGFLGVL